MALELFWGTLRPESRVAVMICLCQNRLGLGFVQKKLRTVSQFGVRHMFHPLAVAHSLQHGGPQIKGSRANPINKSPPPIRDAYSYRPPIRDAYP